MVLSLVANGDSLRLVVRWEPPAVEKCYLTWVKRSRYNSAMGHIYFVPQNVLLVYNVSIRWFTDKRTF